MFFSQKVWGRIVLACSAGGYIPLVVGAIRHPPELNVAAYSLWLILCLMFIGSSVKLGFDGWRLPLGFLIGNGTMLILACLLHGVTFNLGLTEDVVLFGTITTVAVWVVHGHLTGTRNPRILLWGAVMVDVASCYPLFKQYLHDVHEPVTWFAVAGWLMWLAGVNINLTFVEQFMWKLFISRERYQRLYGEEKMIPKLFEASIFSLEQLIVMPATLGVML